YNKCVKPMLEVIGTVENQRAFGLTLVLAKEKMFFLSDTTMSINPSAEETARMAISVADLAKSLKKEARIAMLSYTSLSSSNEGPRKMRKATELVRTLRPDLEVEGELQADTAINPHILNR